MIRTNDRLYGEIKLPKIAKELADTCPILLRLREIRMANIPFFSYPSFANVDRYEHSLGVAHLTWRWSRKNRLPDDLSLALTIAALYHDGATPAFGHLFEEYLGRYGFDHEKTLVNVLIGQQEELPGRENAQVYLGHHCRLKYILPTPSDPSSPLTLIGISDLAAGKGIFGRLIKGDIDFDNIDNVIRAATAMGLMNSNEFIHPYAICDAFALEDGQIRLTYQNAYAVSMWSNARKMVYGNILSNAFEFRVQTAIKWAIEEYSKTSDELSSIGAWKLTDPMLIFDHLRKSPFSRMLIDRIRLGRPPEILFSAIFEDVSALITKGSEITINALCEEIARITNYDVYVNYYLDKSDRSISISPSNVTSLFESSSMLNFKNEQWVSDTVPGLVGFVGLSRVRRASLYENPVSTDSLSKLPLDFGEVRTILEKYMGQSPISLSRGWASAGEFSAPIRQKELFP